MFGWTSGNGSNRKGRTMKFTTALLLVGAAALGSAGPLTPISDNCAEICDSVQSKFRYTPGKTYVYDYEGTTLTTIDGASEEHSGLHVKTTARINVISPCEMDLELRGSELFHVSPTDADRRTTSPVGGAFKAALEERSLRFPMNNGQIGGVCGGGDRDPAWVMNIKRSVISAFQNRMADLERETTLRESDILGTCDTTYKVEGDAIVKTKDLLGCIDREYLNTMIQHQHYMVPSDVQGVPLLRSNQTCKQIVRSGIIHEVECKERHVVRAFSNGESGAVTSLHLKLTFKKMESEVKTLRRIEFKAPLTFDQTKTQREIQDAEIEINTAIEDICKADHAEYKSPRRFAKMIKLVQMLDERTLSRINRRLDDNNVCQLGKKTFHDVLPLAGTTASVSVMKDMLLAGEIDGVEKEMWKSSLAFIPHPNVEMIAHVTPLLRKPDRKIFMSTSTLVRNYCNNRENCENVPQVRGFVTVLEANIGTNCGGRDKDVVLMSLKALGNTGVTLTGRDVLIKCVKNDQISMDLRIAALDAFRHMELTTAKPELIAIYKDMEQNPEIRIQAFITLMKDPCQMCIDAVQETMSKEKVLQVGSFVMSFMENARRSDNPMKLKVNSILRNFDESKITRDWNLERMKYSRAYQASYFSSLLNAGIDSDSQVIFSPEGFLPRQMKTGLNVNLFGRSIDLVEVGTRMEGLETLLEYYFGPSGSLAESGVARHKRAALQHDKINKIHDKVNAQKILKEAHGYMYLRMFGSELGYTDFDLASFLAKKDSINVLSFLRTIAKNHQTEYTQNFQVMDMTYTVPTILGLPLKLNLNAHGTLHLKIGGKFDIVKFMQPPREIDIDGHIKPSAAIEVNTEMGIDAFLTQTGVKLVAQLHSSTSMQGKIILKDGKVFKVHYNVPEQEQEIIHGQTQFFVKHHETERIQRMITQDAVNVEKCTCSKLTSITGLEMCGQLRFPNASMASDAPYFPLTGPVNVRLAIHKRDSQLQSYEFEASQTSQSGIETTKLMFNTPGSQINRELSMILAINPRQQSIDFNMKSPWKKLNAVASLVNNDDLKKVNAKVIVDEEREYSATALVQIQRQGDTLKFIPGLDIKMNGETPMLVKGMVTIERNKKIEVDLNVEKITEKPINFKGSLERVDGPAQLRVNHDLSFTSPLVTFTTKGFIEKRAVRFTIRSDNMFKFREGVEHKMLFNSKLHSEKRQDVRIFNLQSTLGLSDFPDHNLGITVNFKQTDVNTKFDIEGHFRKDMKAIKFTNDITVITSKPIKITVNSDLDLPSHKMSLIHSFIENPENTYKSSSVISWAPGKSLNAEFTIDDTTAENEFIRTNIRGHVEAPFIPRIDITVKPTLTRNEVGLFLQANYDSHSQTLEMNAVRQRTLLTGLWRLTLDANKYELNLKTRRMANLVEFQLNADLNSKIFKINFDGAAQKTALKIHGDMNIMNTEYSFNMNGEMTGQAVKAHTDLTLAERKMEINLDYLRDGYNVKVILNGNGLDLINKKYSSVAYKLHNELTGDEITSLVEIKTNENPFFVVALKGQMTPESYTGNFKLNTKKISATGDLTLNFNEGAYSLLGNLELPTRKLGLEVRFAGDRHLGHINVAVNIDKTTEGNVFSYAIKWSRAAPRDRSQFYGEIVMKQPNWLFPIPVKMSTLFSKDIRGIYKADLVMDYGLKFELKAIHKMMSAGIQTNIEINTPITDYEKMSGELLATLDQSGLEFKIACMQNKDALELKLVGKSDLSLRRSTIDVEFTLKTPFKNVEVITAAFKHKHVNFNIGTSAELKWGINKKVALVFANKFNNLKNFNGRLTVITPIENFETSTFEYKVLTQREKTTGLIQLVWLSQNIFEFTSDLTIKTHQPFGYIHETLLKISGVDVIQTQLDVTYSPMRLFSIKAEGKYKTDNTFTFLTKAEKTSNKIDAIIMLQTPTHQPGYSAKMVINDPNQGSNLDVTVTVDSDNDKILTLTGYLKKEKWSRAEGKFDLTTKFTDKISGDFGWHISKSEGIYNTVLGIEYEPGKKITINEDLLLTQQQRTFTLTIKTPMEHLRLIKYNIQATGNLQNFVGHIERQINDMVVTTDIDAKLVSWNDFSLTLTTKTPIRNYETTTIILSNKGQLTNMETKASLLLAGKTWALTQITQYKQCSDMQIKFTFETPLRNLEKIDIDFSHKGTLRDMTSSLSILFPKLTKPASGELTLKFVELTNMEAKLNLKNVMNHLIEETGTEDVTFSVTNKGESLNPLLTTLTVNIGSQVYSLTSRLNFVELTNMDGSITIHTPISNYEQVGLSWENKITEESTEAKLVIEFQTNQKIEATGSIKKQGQKVETRLEITTPFAAFDRAEFSFDFTGSLLDFEAVVGVVLPKIRSTEVHFSNKMELDNGLSHTGSFRIDCIFFSTTSIGTFFELKDNKLKITTDFGYGLKKGKFAFSGTVTKNTNTLNVELETSLDTDWTAYKSMAGTMGLTTGPRTREYQLNINVKHNSQEIFVLTFQHDPKPTGCISDLIVKQYFLEDFQNIFEQKIHIELDFRKSIIKINTLVDKQPYFTLDLSHTLATDTLIGNALIGYRTFKLEGNLLLSKPRNTYSLHLDIIQNQDKLVEFDTEYKLNQDESHALIVKAVVKGETVIDIEVGVKPNPKDGMIQLRNNGIHIFGWRISLRGHTLEAHLLWKESPMFDAIVTYDVEPLLLNMEIKFKGEKMFVTRNKLDLSRNTLDAMVNFDPIIKKIFPNAESWVLSAKGRVTKRHVITMYELELFKANSQIKIETNVQKSNDLSLRPARLNIDLKISNNFIPESTFGIVFDLNANDQIFKASIISVLENADLLKSSYEIKYTGGLNTHKFEITLPSVTPIGLFITFEDKDEMHFSIKLMKDQSQPIAALSGSYHLDDDSIILTLMTEIPTRKMHFKFNHVKSRRDITHLTEFSWEEGKKIASSWVLTDRSRQSAINYNIDGTIIIPTRTVKYNTKVEFSRNKYGLQISVLPDAAQPERKTFIKIEVNNESYGAMLNYKLDSSFSHPSLDKPLALTGAFTLNRGKILMAVNMDLDYSKFARKKVSTSFRLVDDSKDALNRKYSVVAELKQPANFIDVRTTTTWEKTPTEYKLGNIFSYFTSQRQTKMVETSLNLDLSSKKLTYHVKTPSAERKVYVQLVDNLTIEGRQARLLVRNEDVKRNEIIVVLDVELDERSRSLKIQLGKLLKLESNIQDKYMVHLTVDHESQRLFMLRTNFKDATRMLIHTRIQWDPVLVRSVKEKVPEMAGHVSERIGQVWGPVSKELMDDIQSKVDSIENSLNRDLRPILQAWRQFLRTLDKDMTEGIKSMKQMWRKNEFYLRDATDAAADTYQIVLTYFHDLEARFWQLHSNLIDQLEKNHAELMKTLRDLERVFKRRSDWFKRELKKLARKMENRWEEMRPLVEDCVRRSLEEMEKTLESLVKEMKPRIEALIQWTKTIVVDIKQNVILPLETQFKKYRAELAEKLEPLLEKMQVILIKLKQKIVEKYNEGLADTIREIRENLETQYAETSVAILAYLEELNEAFEARVREWETYPKVREMKESLDKFKAKLIWAWKYLDVCGELKQLAEAIKERHATFWRVVRDNKSRIIVWSPETGSVEFDVEIPIALKDLARLPTFDALIQRVDTVRRELAAAVPKMAWTLSDYYYYYRPRHTQPPPFPAVGIVAGNQHYYTFDGSFFEFAGDCSYVLARDFVDGNFTVVVNYRRTRAGPRRQSITVITGGKTVEIFNTFKTVVDRRNTELPVEFGNAWVKRISENQVRIESQKGVSVTCDMKTDVCTVAMSGWYFGKTGGLLGTYDYEPSTDMKSPMGRVIEDPENFANSWEVAKTCYDKHNYAKSFDKIQNIESTPTYSVCKDLFLEDSSPLRPAFRVVDASPFMSMCINEVFGFQNHPDAEKIMKAKACTAVKAYRTEAGVKGIWLSAPSECVTCTSTAGTPMEVGAEEKVTNPLMGVDTVIVFEENVCNKNRRKDLLGMISNMERAFLAKGLKDNLYGLAAFGGDGVHRRPHFHTIEGKLMNTDRKFIRGVRSLEFTNEPADNLVEDAVAFAARKYPWRAGVQRNVIVVSCSRCKDSALAAAAAWTEEGKRHEMPNLAQLLKERSVHLHLLHDVEFEFRNGKKASNVLGFDHDGVFITKDTTVADLQGDAALLGQLRVPKENCVEAVQESQGSYFTINSYSSGRIRDQKKFLDVFTRRVALTSTPESCQICECRLTCRYSMRPTTICRPCTA